MLLVRNIGSFGTSTPANLEILSLIVAYLWVVCSFLWLIVKLKWRIGQVQILEVLILFTLIVLSKQYKM